MIFVTFSDVTRSNILKFHQKFQEKNMKFLTKLTQMPQCLTSLRHFEAAFKNKN